VPKAWYTDVAADMRDAEVAFLREEIYRRDVDPPMREITAYDRYSARC
jgi:DNA polymerase III subunit epsilon